IARRQRLARRASRAQSQAMSRARRRPGARSFRWLLAWVAAVMLWAGTPSVAEATQGRPQGWQAERATAEVVLGRLQLRYEPAVADEAAFLVEHAPRWWSEIERAVAVD